VAIFHIQISSLGRSAGRRATAAAAYRAGERIRDERSGELHNFSRRRDVLHTEIFLPERFERTSVFWARNREQLWNTAEHAEKRYNARVAREFAVTLPIELNASQRLALARAFARELTERYKVAVDLALHAPPRAGDPRNFHAHLLATTREVTPTGLGARAGLDIDWRERHRRALPDHRQEYVNVRERWASLVNEALEAATVPDRVDHRSLAAQGIEREPLPRIPHMHLRLEQQGLRSGPAERLRERYQERVQGRRARAAGALSRDAGAAGSPGLKDLEEIRRQAREAWLRLRAANEQAGERDAPSSAAQPENDLTR